MKLPHLLIAIILILVSVLPNVVYADECSVPNNRLRNGSFEDISRNGLPSYWSFETDRFGGSFARAEGYAVCGRYYGLITKSSGSTARAYQEVDVTPGAVSVYFSAWGGIHALCGAEFRLILLTGSGSEISRQTVRVEKNVNTGRSPYLQKYELAALLPANVRKVRVEAVMNRSTYQNGNYLKIENAVLTFQDDSHLPVKLSSFTVAAESESAVLKWQTASEDNTREFAVQHSGDGLNWENIGAVKSAGSVSAGTTYQFVHDTPLRSNNYYRLKMIDNDGSFEYSPIRAVKFSGNVDAYLYPNPSRGEVNFNSLIRKVSVFDATGRLVRAIESRNATSKIDLSNLAEGNYIIRWIDITGGENTKRLTVAR